jgi:NAD(P)-dependent dehydrogenase (short-subunit alcohol dehydrogenase family)
MTAPALLASSLLHGRGVALAGGVRPEIVAALAGLGARTIELGGLFGETWGETWADEHGPVHALVYDAAGAFAAGGGSGALRAAVDDGWTAIQALASTVFIPAELGAAIVLLAPPAGAGAHVSAARAALENTARTLSVEWARYGITTTAVTPGAETSDAELATLVAFLVSPAGAYFSGCRFDLGVARAAAREP